MVRVCWGGSGVGGGKSKMFSCEPTLVCPSLNHIQFRFLMDLQVISHMAHDQQLRRKQYHPLGDICLALRTTVLHPMAVQYKEPLPAWRFDSTHRIGNRARAD